MTQESITQKIYSFSELPTDLLYTIMQMREKVFVVEQNCPYLDADGKDLNSYHFLLFYENEIVGYQRLLPPGVSYEKYASIGRVLTPIEFRGKNYGREMISRGIKACLELFDNHSIKISAQSRLNKLYSEFGFEETGEHYLEDDIPHSAMIYAVSKIS